MHQLPPDFVIHHLWHTDLDLRVYQRFQPERATLNFGIYGVGMNEQTQRPSIENNNYFEESKRVR